MHLGEWGALGAWAVGWLLFWRLPRLRVPAVGEDLLEVSDHHADPRAAVIVPARDEAATLPILLGSLAGTDPRVDEVVVVDDASTDATASVARACGARVVVPDARPPEATGKVWACATGVDATASPDLVFVDADVEVAPAGLGAVLDHLATTGGLVSVEPHHRIERPYEQLSALPAIVAVMATGAASPWRPALRAAFGPLLACHRTDYEDVGGHLADPGAVAEDIALAARFRADGHPVAVLGGGDLIRFRMYPAGIGQLVEGWTKNLATGAGATRPLRLLAVVAWVTALCWSMVALAAAPLAPTTAPAWAVGLSVAFAVQVWAMARQLGSFGPWPALALPLHVAGFVALFARSVQLTVVRRQVVWKGRAVPIRTAAAGPRLRRAGAAQDDPR